ncbi:MAG: hypothetical protein LBE92_00945 [Chryseobacterium sp.]|jgi:hypothetical protein|uniref:hypothetical protein n=1 Tax=Chryseobacterium sp. TaxID=1871047 RepID=UPI00281E70B9|nr:hypothetical protein [Chryseobacterium sp.]MDR2234666.1 hypothetical protein [Chryseobacterium sp.]
MKSILLKTQKIIFLLFGFGLAFAQTSMKLPKETVFYMEINGKQLNKKINWEKFNPLLQEMTKSSKEKASWNDYSKTGIKYDDAQYHYACFNDSVKTYNAHFILNNTEKFKEFIHSIKKKGQEVSPKKNYSYVDLDDDMFVAWNDQRAVLSLVSYTRPYKDIWATEAAVDSAAVVADSAAAAIVDSAYIEEAERPFNYKEEIKDLKDQIKYLRESIKENNTEIARIQKDIKYLEKHHQYPEEKKQPEYEEEPEMAEGDYDIAEADSIYQKEQDSIQRENFKVVKKLAEDGFDRYFSSNFNIDVPKDKLNFRDSGSDVFIYTDYGRMVNEGLYGRMMKNYGIWQFFGKAYNSDSVYNLYFDTDKVKLVNNYQHKDSDIQKSISEVYKGKKNKKLAALISDKSLGYYVMNINGQKSFDMMYDLFKNTGDAEYQKEIELVMETVKIILDEEAISKIAPGNGIFVLNELKSKKVDYTDYEYDEDYNEKPVQKTKDVMVPNFTFAFATENEGYWNRLFSLLVTNKELAKKFTKNGDFYSFKDEKKTTGYLDQMFFTVKDGIVYLTSFTDNINPKNQSDVSKKWSKDSSKYPLSGRLDLQRLLIGFEKEFKSPSERKTLDMLRKNAGEVYYKTEVKNESIRTEIDYNIKNSSENSLMYFFDLFDEFFKIKEADKKAPIL